MFLARKTDHETVDDMNIVSIQQPESVQYAEIDGSVLAGESKKLFNDSYLGQVSRRTGIKLESFREALGTLEHYRLQGGLLQKSVFSRAIGTHEYMTVIPEGIWRTVEHAGSTRRLSLRRYIILLFHCTALGPHRDRDRTCQAISDAGLWWPKMWKEVESIVRHCLICLQKRSLWSRAIKDLANITVPLDI